MFIIDFYQVCGALFDGHIEVLLVDRLELPESHFVKIIFLQVISNRIVLNLLNEMFVLNHRIDAIELCDIIAPVNSGSICQIFFAI